MKFGSALKSHIVIMMLILLKKKNYLDTTIGQYTHFSIVGAKQDVSCISFKNGKVKVEVGLAKGKKLYDKRADMAKKDQQREALRDYKVSLR